jgi:hypothetical protein
VVSRSLILLICLAWVAPVSAAVNDKQSKTYKWTDHDGRVHYGDRVPPEFVDRDREVLNEQAVRVGIEEGADTPEERAEKQRLKTLKEEARAAKLAAAKRDRILLETYLSIDEIEMLRDRRLELMESQIKVTEQYLNNLRKRLLTLQQEAIDYKPYSDKPDAPEIPDNLDLDISRTVASINLYERTLATTRGLQEEVREKFARDIVRFAELKTF